MWLPLVVAVCILLLTLFYRKRKNEQGLFRRLGIPGPPTHWLFGNLVDFKEKFVYLRYQEWTKKYGKIYGYYEGPSPFMVTSDVDFLQQVFVKQFSSFHGRREFMIQHEPDSPIMIHMLMARGKRWKRLRTITNPTFSTAKMKQISPIMNSCVDALMEVLEKKRQENSAIDIYDVFQGFTLDVIARAGFGMDVDSQRNPDDPFLKNCRWIFETTSSPALLYFIAGSFPEIRPWWQSLWYVVKYFQGNPYVWLGNMLGEVVKMRKNMTEDKRVDLIRLLIDAEEPSTTDEQTQLSAMTADEDAEVENEAANTKNAPRTSKGQLTKDEVRMQSELLLIAAYETTSTMLGYVTYLLAQNPDVQLKLQQEIDKSVGEDEVTYTQVHAMPYLDMVICESLRMYPVASLIMGRKCMHTCTISGVEIPAGLTVVADVWSVHFDPDLWGPEPEKFDPERFSADKKKERHPLAWIPFGAGPRNCIGLRFAMLELKITLATVLRKYTLEMCEQTQVPLCLKEGATVTPKYGVIVKLVTRESHKSE